MVAYSAKAQPFLDAIASEVFGSQSFRDWVIRGTPAETAYRGSDVLFDEQRAVRWRTKVTKQPFWANYFCGLDSRCACRLPGSKALESDAIFFLRNAQGRVLAIHVELKRWGEQFGFGQPESYSLRAACFARTHSSRPAINPHHDWTTVLVCGDDILADPRAQAFHRVITHREVATMVPNYPSG